MADDTVGKLSGSNNPYKPGGYSPGSNDKNTLNITSYFKLLASQLANQDMTKPMDNSEMMAQMTQMAMVQSLGAMTDAIQTSTAIGTHTYAMGLAGHEVTVAVTKEGAYGQPVATGVKYGKVASVDLTGNIPIVKLEGDDTKYPLSNVLGMGHIEDPYNKKDDEDVKPEDGKPQDGDGVKPEDGAGDKSKSLPPLPEKHKPNTWNGDGLLA